MSINQEAVEQLVFKFNSGNITPEELQILQDWYNSHDDQQVTIATKTLEYSDQVRSRILENLLARIAADQPQPAKQQKLWPRIAVAAAAIATIVFGLWFFSAPHHTIINHQPEIAIKAGGNKAILTLQDGRNITLSSSQTGILTGDEITYTNGNPIEDTELDKAGDIQKLTLKTPRGGIYTLTLSDGTRVWLNAASTIKYPSKFTSGARVVELEGEAYFQVMSSYDQKGKKIPFKVISNQQEVEVLGTQFNMNAYPDQAFTKTTLVEGSVKVREPNLPPRTGINDDVMLKPGQQAVVSDHSAIKVKKVEVENYTAWRDGKFSFDGKNFEEIMNDIARWYDLHIVYENGIPDEELAGDAYRNQNIRFVLRLLDVAQIDYKLDAAGRKLTIKGKKNRM